MNDSSTKRILILGGGFAGVSAAKQLEKDLAQYPNVEITLISRQNFFLFTPMLHEVATSDLGLTAVVNPVRKMLTRTQIFIGEIKSIDLSRREVVVSHGFDHHEHAFMWDHLVIGLGSRNKRLENRNDLLQGEEKSPSLTRLFRTEIEVRLVYAGNAVMLAAGGVQNLL